METSLKTGFAQIFSRCPENLSCPKFGGAAAPLVPPARTPMIVCFWIQFWIHTGRANLKTEELKVVWITKSFHTTPRSQSYNYVQL